MKILIIDEEHILSVYEIIGADNGITSIEFEGIGNYGEEVEFPNAVRFTTLNDEYIYLFVDIQEGNDIVKNLYENNEMNLYQYEGMVLFFPFNDEDKEELNRILKEYNKKYPKNVFQSNYKGVL